MGLKFRGVGWAEDASWGSSLGRFLKGMSIAEKEQRSKGWAPGNTSMSKLGPWGATSKRDWREDNDVGGELQGPLSWKLGEANVGVRVIDCRQMLQVVQEEHPRAEDWPLDWTTRRWLVTLTGASRWKWGQKPEWSPDCWAPILTTNMQSDEINPTTSFGPVSPFIKWGGLN